MLLDLTRTRVPIREVQKRIDELALWFLSRAPETTKPLMKFLFQSTYKKLTSAFELPFPLIPLVATQNVRYMTLMLQASHATLDQASAVDLARWVRLVSFVVALFSSLMLFMS